MRSENRTGVRAARASFGGPGEPWRPGRALGEWFADALLASATSARPGATAPSDGHSHPPSHAATQLRKGDVVTAAKAKGVSFVEGSYNKIMRELCRNNAGTWTPRAGAHDGA